MPPFRAWPPSEFRPCQCHLLRGSFQWGAGRRRRRGLSSGSLGLVACLVLPSCPGTLSEMHLQRTGRLPGPPGLALSGGGVGGGVCCPARAVLRAYRLLRPAALALACSPAVAAASAPAPTLPTPLPSPPRPRGAPPADGAPVHLQPGPFPASRPLTPMPSSVSEANLPRAPPCRCAAGLCAGLRPRPCARVSPPQHVKSPHASSWRPCAAPVLSRALPQLHSRFPCSPLPVLIPYT